MTRIRGSSREGRSGFIKEGMYIGRVSGHILMQGMEERFVI